MNTISPTQAVIQLNDVSLTYPGAQHAAIAGVSLTIHAGEHVCILGGNGSGKSSLAQLINGLLLPSNGTVRILGTDVQSAQDALTIRRQTAMVFQHPEDQMVASIVADDVAFGPENLGIPPTEIARRVDQALVAVGMDRFSQADPADLSGGQKQRVAIAGALAMAPQILILDEPGAMLDTQGRNDIRALIEQVATQGTTVLHITHFMEDALRADRVLVLSGGRIALDGTPHEAFSQPERMRALGLDLPFTMRFSERLRTKGIDVPQTADSSKLLDALASHMHAYSSAHTPNDSHASNHSSPASALHFEDVSFCYAKAAHARRKPRHFARRTAVAHDQLTLQEVNFTVARGSLTALVGQTGAGKSTTVELACALKLPYTGTVQVNNIDTLDWKRRSELRAQVGYVSQLPERQLFAQTVYEDIAFGPRNLKLPEEEVKNRVYQALEQVGLSATQELLQSSPFALSGGQQRCVALAGVLAMRQPILVLDEPMAGLDPAGRARMRALILQLKAHGTTILLVTHAMDDVARMADNMCVLDHGTVVLQGTPRTVFEAFTTPVFSSLGLGLPHAYGWAQKLSANTGIDLGTPLTLDDLVEKVISHVVAR